MRLPATKLNLRNGQDHLVVSCLSLVFLVITPQLGPCLQAEEPKERATLKGHRGTVESVAFSPDGKTLASGASYDQTIRLWDVTTGKERGTLRGHGTCLTSVAFSPDGKTLASASYDHTIKLWDVATGQERATLKWPTREQRPSVALAFSPDSKTLASASGGTVILWDVATGRERATLKGNTTVAFSPDGKTLASGSWDTVKLWDVATGKERASLKGHTKSVEAVAFSPNGKTLVSGSFDNTIRLWEVASRKERATLKAHPVWSVTFSSNGKFLASANDDRTIKLWDVATGKEQATFKGHTESVHCVAFSPDGKTLASGGEDNTIKLWDIPAARKVEAARSGILATEDLGRLWTTLAGDDAAKAYQAIGTLVSAPDQAVPLVKERLRAIPKPNMQAISQWITALESEQFAVREGASEALERIGDVAEPALRTKLAEKPSLEVSQRIERLLSKIEEQQLDAQSLRGLRAVEVLEHIGSPGAKKVLETLATGAECARLTREAQASVERLNNRPGADK